MTRLIGTPRAAGVWGIVFSVLLLASAAMVSLPTSAQTGEQIVAFYSAHAQVIVIQQVVGLAALGAFIAFALSLPPNRWVRPALGLFVIAELATNIVPLLIVATHPSGDTAHALTFVEDIADSALFLSIAVFVAVATLKEPTWLRIAAYVVAAAGVLRGIGGPFGFTSLDVAAPLAFLALILVLSVRSFVGPRPATPRP